MSKPVEYIADHLRRVLVDGASAPHTAEVQKFFKDEVQSRGWYTPELRKLARRFSRVIRSEEGIDYLVAVADELFHGSVLEEKILAVLLLEPCGGELTSKHFKLFDGWLDRVTKWADHDALVQSIVGPMIVADPRRVRGYSCGRDLRTAGDAALRPWRCCGAPTGECSGTRCNKLRSHWSRTPTIWCRRGWAGCCGRRRGSTARAPFHCCCRSGHRPHDWCCERRVIGYLLGIEPAYWRAEGKPAQRKSAGRTAAMVVQLPQRKLCLLIATGGRGSQQQ